MNTEKNLLFMKLGTKLFFSDSSGSLKDNLSLDCQIQIEKNFSIDLYDIYLILNKKSFQTIKDKNYSMNINKERYVIKNNETNKEYQLDDILNLFYKKLKQKFIENNENCIERLLLIYDIISYDMILIMQQAALINGLDIIHIIDTSKTLAYYLDAKKLLPKTLKNKYITIIIINNKHIDISVYSCSPIRKLFNILKEITKIFENFKETIYDFIMIDNSNEQFLEIKKYIAEQIENEIGNQDFQNIEQIYLFNYNKINKQSFVGASNSLTYERSQQCMAIFKIIDLKYENQINEISMILGDIKYNLNVLKKEEFHILLDEVILFEGCFYKTIELILYDSYKRNTSLITIYFNQINYYYISIDMKYCNSMEIIFFNINPEINFENNTYKKILYEEKFEEKEVFKRINLININRETIKLNLISDYYDMIFSSEPKPFYKNLTVIVGKDKKILAFYSKYESIMKSDNSDLLSSVQFADKLSSNLSFKEFESYKKELNQMIFDVRFNDNLMDKKKIKDIRIWNNTHLLMAYGKYLIFKATFENKEKNGKIDYNENNYKKFQNIMKQVENFHEKCKNCIKNKDLTISQLFLTSCIAFKDYLKYNNYSDSEIDLIDLIDFKKEGTIYNAGYENNIEFIKNLNKDSFLYPIFLQFNSGFKDIFFDDDFVNSCMISKITLEQIKLDLIKSLDNYGIRIFFKTNYFATTTLNTSITIYNENKVFGKKLNEKELLVANDSDYHKRTSISFLQKHERFSHLKKIFNKSELNYVDSPRGYIDFENNRYRILVSYIDNIEPKEEIGESLEFFMTNGKNYLINNLFNYRTYNFEKLFKVNLFMEEKNDNLIKILKEIPGYKEEDEEESEDEKNIDEKKENNENNNNKKYKSDKINNKEKKIYGYKNKISKEYIREKNQLIKESPFRKFTFNNTIRSCKFDSSKNKLVPEDEFS